MPQAVTPNPRRDPADMSERRSECVQIQRNLPIRSKPRECHRAGLACRIRERRRLDAKNAKSSTGVAAVDTRFGSLRQAEKWITLHGLAAPALLILCLLVSGCSGSNA